MSKELRNRVDPRRAALLVIDVQNDYCHPEGSLGKAGIDLSMMQAALPCMLKFIEAARQASFPIIFIANRHDHWTNSPSWIRRHAKKGRVMAAPGSWGAKFCQVSPKPGEPTVLKHRYSAFIYTELDLLLRSRGIKNLVIIGGATNICVESTARDAFMNDYQLVFVKDCLAASSKREHVATLRNMKKYFDTILTTSDKIMAIWERRKPSALS
jgi:ureidoacrylate peracid hydrolase